jgi:hypothetical protein
MTDEEKSKLIEIFVEGFFNGTKNALSPKKYWKCNKNEENPSDEYKSYRRGFEQGFKAYQDALHGEMKLLDYRLTSQLMNNFSPKKDLPEKRRKIEEEYVN